MGNDARSDINRCEGYDNTFMRRMVPAMTNKNSTRRERKQLEDRNFEIFRNSFHFMNEIVHFLVSEKGTK